MRAVVAHRRVACRAGHKVSKSASLACLALWWVVTRPQGQVIMTSAGARQVKQILWKELRARYIAAERHTGVTLGGRLAIDPGTGLTWDDGRSVLGFTVADTEAMGGYSGVDLLFLVDEAPGVPEDVFEAIEGNRAAGATLVLTGNPIRTSGTMYDAFHSKRGFWNLLHLPSTDSPNVRAGRIVISGLATREWVEEKREEWGETSPLWAVRVLGNFPGQGSNAVIALDTVEAAQVRYREAVADEVNDPGKERLEIGLDVARFGDDETVAVARRGLWMAQPKAWRGLDGPGVAGAVLGWLRPLRRKEDTAVPRVKVDVIGVGASAFDALKDSTEVEAVAVNVSEAPTAEPVDQHDPGWEILRDQIWFGVDEWLRAGGRLVDDDRLAAELVAPTYRFTMRGKRKVEPKADMKRRLNRSPDRADALGLAIYEPPQRKRFTFV